MMSCQKENLLANEYLDKKSKKKYYSIILNLVKNTNKSQTQKDLNIFKSKLDDYKNIQRMDLFLDELKPLIPNMEIDSSTIEFLNFIGIEKIQTNYFSLNIYLFIKGLIGTMLHETDFDEKVDYTFNMYDKNKDGIISKSDIESFLNNFNQYNSLYFDEETIKGISNVLSEELDKNKDGNITKASFREFLLENKDSPLTLNPFKKNLDFTVAICEPINDIENVKINAINSKISNEDEVKSKSLGGLFLFVRLNIKNLIWFSAYLTWTLYIVYDQFDSSKISSYKTYGHIGSRLSLLNLSILLFMMCENLWTIVRGTFLFHILPIDNIKLNHEMSATAYVIAGCGHGLINSTWGWISSCENLSCYFDKFMSTLGWTGSLMIIIFTVMGITSIRCMRRKNYEVFSYLHKLFMIAMVLLFIHHENKQFWKWTLWPLTILAIEYLVKFVRFFIFKTRILSVKLLEGNVVELVIKKPKFFSFKPGQFLRLQIPEISFFEWHAFTMASSPLEPNLVFYISSIGNWTKNLAKIGQKTNYIFPNKMSYFDRTINNIKNKKIDFFESTDDEEYRKNVKKVMDNVVCRIDGPLGAPAQKYEGYKRLMLIAQGIGATPFASILLNMLAMMKMGKESNIIEVDFYWINRNKISSQWLVKRIKNLMEFDTEKKITFHLFLTAPQQKYDLRSFFLWKGLDMLKKRNKDCVSSYCGNIYWGRPDWKKLFSSKRKEHDKNEGNIGVFVCGNDNFTSDVYSACKAKSGRGITFEFHKEHF
jgi:predicted ferric reductase/Ca2+-binding EF-hand superfamily protein